MKICRENYNLSGKTGKLPSFFCDQIVHPKTDENTKMKFYYDENHEYYKLSFYQGIAGTKHPEKTENKNLNVNIGTIFSCAIRYGSNTRGPYRLPFEIVDTKTYIMAFFTDKPNFSYRTFESSVWGWIGEDKKFLQKYDEIMNILTIK